MTIKTFVDGYPPDGFSLGQTKTIIRDNLDGTFETFSVDHYNQNDIPGNVGKHMFVEMPVIANASVPNIVGQNTLFIANDIYSTPQLFMKFNGTGNNNQLTGPVLPNTVSNGYSTLPGGLLIQWGSTSVAGTTANQLYPIPFPSGNAPFVNVGCVAGSNSGVTVTITKGTSPSSFSITVAPGGQTVNWIAIGL